jgi:hypothetical protein
MFLKNNHRNKLTAKTLLLSGVEQRPVSMFALSELLYAEVSIFSLRFPGNCAVIKIIFTEFVLIVRGYKLYVACLQNIFVHVNEVTAAGLMVEI